MSNLALSPSLRRLPAFLAFCHRASRGVSFSAQPKCCETHGIRSWTICPRSAAPAWTHRQWAPSRLVLARWKTGYKNRAGTRDAVEEGDEGSGDDDELSDGQDDETSLDSSRYIVPGLPVNFKVVKHHLATLRTDAVLAAGLNISRRKIGEEFLNSKLIVNGERLLKKGVQLKAGDVADLVVEQLEGGATKVKRVRVIHVDEKRASSGRTTVILQAWRTAFSPP